MDAYYFSQARRCRTAGLQQCKSLDESNSFTAKYDSGEYENHSRKFRWYAAFHNEGHHPHIHMIAYSTKPNEAYLTEKGIENIKSNLAKVIFRQDLISIYQKQTEHRDKLHAEARDIVEDLVSKINSEIYISASIQHKLLELADRLSKTKGKKVYGYLKPDVKAIVDSIVDELANDSRIKKLYDLWYEQKENTIRTYTDEMPERIPLVDNKEFKSIKMQ